MDSKRQGEIAIKLLKHLLRDQGIHLSSQEDMREKVAKVSVMIGVSTEELMEFAKPIILEFVLELLGDCPSNSSADSDKPKRGVPLGDVLVTERTRVNLPPNLR